MNFFKRTLNNYKKMFSKFDNRKFYLFVGIFFIFNFFLFSAQCLIPPGANVALYESDIPAHLNIITKQVDLDLIGDDSYSLFHTIIKILYLFKSIELINLCTPIILAITNVFTLLLLKKYFTKSIKKEDEWIANFLAIISITVTMIMVPLHRIFFGIGSPNQWQSPTYTMLRPFMILAFMEFEKLFLTKETKKPWLFILWTTISMIAKPSFLMCFIPGSLITIFLLNISKFKLAIKESLKLFAYYLPALLIFIYQSILVTSDVSTIAFMFGGNWVKYAPYNCVPYAILIGNLFFLLVLAKNRKKLDTPTLCILSTFICAIIEALTFGETGYRGAHLNFLGPYFCAMFLSYLPTLKATYITKEYKSTPLIFIALLLHTYSGFIYFIRFLMGYSYF